MNRKVLINALLGAVLLISLTSNATAADMDAIVWNGISKT